MKKIKRLITNAIIRLTPHTYVCGENVSVYNNTDAIKYFTACGISITNVFIPCDRIVFVLDDKYETLSRLDVTTFGMSYGQLVSLYEKASSLGPAFVKVIRAFTRALANADLINIESVSIEHITDVFNNITSNIIERNNIRGNIFTTKNLSLLLKKFGGTKGLTKLFQESIDASMDYCLLGESPGKMINNRCITCSRCRIVDNIRTCDDKNLRISGNDNLSDIPDHHVYFSGGKLWSEYILGPQTRCSLYNGR